eukprot:NODE_933_length_2690_cov_14.382755.p1 GENE.NODE_933_length_2690_cov_14.382755~~NODE_933_length_2690_cov_14.382755.p1  ORF type:complete len:806 (+),score=195.38 NODE_933_length_2690_cov_14.382755:313-2418(+)
MLTFYYWMRAGEMISCGFVWCYRASTDENDRFGFMATMGSLAFLMCLVTALLSLGLLLRTYRPVHSPLDAEALPADAEAQDGGPAVADLHAMVRSAARSCEAQRRIAAVAMLLAVPATLLLVGLLPNTFELFSRYPNSVYHSISIWVASTVGPYGDLESDTTYSWFRSLNWRWSDLVVVKFFPDTLFYYAFIFGVILVGALGAEFRCVKAMLSVKVERFGVQLSRVLLIAAFAVFLSLYAFYWAHDHFYHNDGKFNAIALEVFNRVCGLLAVAVVGLLLLPAAKGSPVLAAIGVSWESALWAHICLGNIFLLFAVCHVVGYIVRFVQLGHPADFLPLNWNFWYPTNPIGGSNPSDNFAVPWQSGVFYIALVCYGVFPWLRRSSYELFRYSHNIGLVMVPAMFFHATGSWYFLLPGVVLWCVDRALRFMSAAEPVCIKELTPLAIACKTDAAPGRPSQNAPERITKVAFAWRGQERIHSPGMYVLVNFPQLSLGEWHPFSLSSSPMDMAATLHVKDMGPGTFTNQLHELAGVSCGGGDGVVMNVQGPYGPVFDTFATESLLLVAGGIGITPMVNTLRFAVQCARLGQCGTLQRLHLLWCSRSAGIFDAFGEELGMALEGAGGPLDVRLSLYSSTADGTATCRLGTVKASTPNFPEILAEELERGDGRVRIRACGPPPMVQACEAAAAALDERVRFEPWSFVL